jgi:16S rRNA processing protein RimM
MIDQKLTIATVLKPQGIRGEIKVKVLSDSAEDLTYLKNVFIGGIEYQLMNVRPAGDCAYIVLKGVADRNGAELLRGNDVEVWRSDMPELPDGRYYIADLTGCTVVSDTGEVLGVVDYVTPAKTDIYTLKTKSGEVSFAAADGVIEDVNIADKKITVNLKRFKEVSV